MNYAEMTKDQLIVEVEQLQKRLNDIEAAECTLKRVDEERKELEARLMQSQKMEAVGQLAGGIAHDFNNLLSVIINYAYLLKPRLSDDSKSKDMIEQILSLSGRGSDIIRGLLAFSRKPLVTQVPLNLNDAVTSMERLLRKYIDEDIELVIKLSPEPPVVMADSSQIEQIIMNLVTNARDAMPDGGVLEIETGLIHLDGDSVHTRGVGEPGLYALLNVKDTGSGMDSKTSHRIFEPYFTTKDAGKGSGLGLATVYGIVKQYGGHIAVRSAPQKGTTFEIYFKASSAREEKKKAAPAPLPRGRPEAVLIAEDELSVRMSEKKILEEFGYKVIEAVDGEDAVRQFREHEDEIRLVVMDIVMPKKSGKEAYEEIMKIRPGLKVIFTSGYSCEAIRRKGDLNQDCHYVVKPVPPDVLLKKIEEVLSDTG